MRTVQQGSSKNTSCASADLGIFCCHTPNYLYTNVTWNKTLKPQYDCHVYGKVSSDKCLSLFGDYAESAIIISVKRADHMQSEMSVDVVTVKRESASQQLMYRGLMQPMFQLPQCT